MEKSDLPKAGMRVRHVQFTIRSLMVAVAVVAGLVALSLSPTGLVVAFGLLYFALIGAWRFDAG